VSGAPDPPREPLDLAPIKERLRSAGYEHPDQRSEHVVREPTRAAQEARAVLRDHIIEDVWALLDEVERLRALGR
jgi:hypothetical protein